jgi:hypothetical protein
VSACFVLTDGKHRQTGVGFGLTAHGWIWILGHNIHYID